MVKFYYSYKHDLRNRNAPLVTEHAIQRLEDDPIETTALLSGQHLDLGGAFDHKNFIGGRLANCGRPWVTAREELLFTTRRCVHNIINYIIDQAWTRPADDRCAH